MRWGPEGAGEEGPWRERAGDKDRPITDCSHGLWRKTWCPGRHAQPPGEGASRPLCPGQQLGGPLTRCVVAR